MKLSKTLTILFADIVGSTSLYDELGDVVAENFVSETILRLVKVLPRHHGHLIKTIGDEVMCTFPDANHAANAAIDMQSEMEHPVIADAETARQLEIRIGFHHGSVIYENNDVFGDTVNLASRISSLANGLQILTTKTTANLISESHDLIIRDLDKLPIRGKQEAIGICEIAWQTDDVTEIARLNSSAMLNAVTKLLHIRYSGNEFYLDTKSVSTTLGRGDDCDITVNDDLASRKHVKINCRNGKFFLSDISTNGTYVESETGSYYLRREELMLSGKGRISLGRNFRKEKCEVLEFNLIESPVATTS